MEGKETFSLQAITVQFRKKNRLEKAWRQQNKAPENEKLKIVTENCHKRYMK